MLSFISKIYKSWQTKTLEGVVLDSFKILLLILLSAIAVGMYIAGSYFYNEIEYIKNEPERLEKIHTKEVDIRFRNSKRIKEELEWLRNTTKADRVFILEFHNGIKTYTRCPYVRVSMTYENISYDSNMDYIDEEIKDLSVNKFSFIDEHIYDKEYNGSTDSIMKEDIRLGRLLEKNKTKYIIFETITTDNSPVAVLGVAFNSLVENPTNILRNSRMSVMRINKYYNEERKIKYENIK